MTTTLDQLIDADEIERLRSSYGEFCRRHVRLSMSEGSLAFYRRAFRDRRGEVLFVLCRGDGCVLLHTKASYPPGVFRLPGGGIHWDEPIREALYREVHEETQFEVRSETLLGLLTYEFQGQNSSVPFVSYVFAVSDLEGEPEPLDASEAITEFRWVPKANLASVAEGLRILGNDAPGRADWGRFRAEGHDFVHQSGF